MPQVMPSSIPHNSFGFSQCHSWQEKRKREDIYAQDRNNMVERPLIILCLQLLHSPQDSHICRTGNQLEYGWRQIQRELFMGSQFCEMCDPCCETIQYGQSFPVTPVLSERGSSHYEVLKPVAKSCINEPHIQIGEALYASKDSLCLTQRKAEDSICIMLSGGYPFLTPDI